MADSGLSGELKAMAALEQAMKELPEDAQQRVLRWASERFGFTQSAPARRGSPGNAGKENDGEEDQPEVRRAPRSAATLAEFYDQAAPSTDAAKVLVVSHWYQFEQGAAEIEARQVNTELKHLGHGVGNVTRAFDKLKSQKPALMVQTRKDGTTKQAQKKFKVTAEGKKAVDRMLAGEESGA